MVLSVGKICVLTGAGADCAMLLARAAMDAKDSLSLVSVAAAMAGKEWTVQDAMVVVGTRRETTFRRALSRTVAVISSTLLEPISLLPLLLLSLCTNAAALDNLDRRLLDIDGAKAVDIHNDENIATTVRHVQYILGDNIFFSSSVAVVAGREK